MKGESENIECLAADDDSDGLGELIANAQLKTIENLCAKYGIKWVGGEKRRGYSTAMRRALYKYFLGDREYEAASLHSEYAI